MTEKQEDLLIKFISKDRIELLKKLDFEYTSDFINLIMNTSSVKYFVGRTADIDIKKEIEFNEDEKKNIEEIINKNRNNYTDIDEFCSLINIFIIPKYDKKIYVMKQTWFKGMSNSSDFNYFCITEDGEKYNGMYNVLFDLKIYTLQDFLIYLKENDFK